VYWNGPTPPDWLPKPPQTLTQPDSTWHPVLVPQRLPAASWAATGIVVDTPAAWAALSSRRTVNGAPVTDGVPETVPSPESDNPVGRAPALTDHR
jgi:hypothetical protein